MCRFVPSFSVLVSVVSSHFVCVVSFVLSSIVLCREVSTSFVLFGSCVVSLFVVVVGYLSCVFSLFYVNPLVGKGNVSLVRESA